MAKVKQNPEPVLYLGNDTGFFQNIIQRYRHTYDKMAWDFPAISLKENDIPENLFLRILERSPKIVYIDFCLYPDLTIELAELMSRDPYFGEIPIVGLVDDKDDTVPLLGTGIDFIYVKGGEFHDIIYAPMNIAFPKAVVKPQFAKGKVSEEVDLIDDFRVSYITPSYIHVEGNFYLEENQEVFFKTDIPLKNVPSYIFEVKNRLENNLYYEYNYSYDFDFRYVDPPEFKEEQQDDGLGIQDEKDRVKAIKLAKEKQREVVAEFEESLKRSQKKHKEWVLDQMDDKPPKKTKLLIVDESMRLFEQTEGEGLSRSPYMIRCQTRFEDGLLDINRIRPAIIAYQSMSEYGTEEEEAFHEALARLKNVDAGYQKMEDADLEANIEVMMEAIPEREKEEVSFISRLIEFIKGVENYSPIIVIFRCYYKTSKSLQESFQYPMLVTHSESISLKVCQDLAAIYENKQDEKLKKLVKAKVAALKAQDPNKYRRLTESDFEEKKFFVKQKNSLAYGSIKLPVILSNISESEIQFKTELLLPMKTYRLDFPLAMSIHLVPIEEGKNFSEEAGLKTYRGIIHSISETDKKSLRQQVNEVFFEPLKEQRQKEQAEFNELNEKVKKEIEEREQILEERAKEALGIQEEIDNDASRNDPDEKDDAAE